MIWIIGLVERKPFVEINLSVSKKLTNAEFLELGLVLEDGGHVYDVQVGPVEPEVGEAGKRLQREPREARLHTSRPLGGVKAKVRQVQFPNSSQAQTLYQ